LYLAPEMLEGGEASVRTDVYGLGVLLYHLLTGAYPVQAGRFAELRDAHRRRARKALAAARSGLPSGLIRTVERAAAHDSALRYETVDALARELAYLTPRAAFVKRVRMATAAAAIAAVVWTGWEVRGRQVDRTSPTRAALAAWLPATTSDVEAVQQPVIAVLPLENLSAEPDSEYFADGLTEEIIQNLAGIDGLEVKSRTSSFAFKGRPRNVREVGEQLGVNLIVEGSVQRAGSRLKVIARLVQVAGDVPLWSDRWERDNTVRDIFAIQNEVSTGIVNKLRLKLGAGQRRYDTNIDTYNLYLRARAAVGKRGAQAQEAAQLFQQVIDRDPAFAPAHAGLADAYAFMSRYVYGPSATSMLPRMRQAAKRSLELDELLAEGHAAMGLVDAREQDWSNAERSFQRAIELNPSLTQSYTNYSLETLLPLERTVEAEELLRVALRYDPVSLSVRRELALVLTCAGRYDEAIETLQQIHKVDPHFEFVDLHLARALTLAGRLPEALAAWEVWWSNIRSSVGAETERPGSRFWMSSALVMAGRRAEVEAMAAEPVHPFRLAVIHAALGDKDRTFDALDRAVVTVPHRVALILAYPEMALLRGDPRLTVLRRRLNLP
jgi:TolB-like protein/tetratricopeptide (TPR) repeat protein